MSDKVDSAVSEIDKNYPYRTIELHDIDLIIHFNNDLRKPIEFEIEGFFVDNNSVDEPAMFEVNRREDWPMRFEELNPPSQREKSQNLVRE